MRNAFCAALVICGLVLPANAQQQQPPAEVPVGVVKAERKPVADTLDFVGRVDAINRVEIKALEEETQRLRAQRNRLKRGRGPQTRSKP